MASNSSRIADGTNTDKDRGMPSSKRASPFPQNCSPQRLENINLTVDLEIEGGSAQHKKKKKSYSHEENEHLANCWIDISTNSVIDNAQKLDRMWMRIGDVYNKNRPVNTPVRPWANLKTHFYTLQKQAKWFGECYNRNAKFCGSGSSDADIIELAQKEYINIHNKYGFNHTGMWRILSACPKFAKVDRDTCGTKKTKTSESGEYTSSSNPDSSTNEDIDVERIWPIGQKVAKMKAKGKRRSEGYEDLIERIDRAVDIFESYTKKKMEVIARLVRTREYKILMKDTVNMTTEQLIIHQSMCNEIKKNWGM